METNLAALFEKHLIIFTQSNAKYDGCHVFEAMNPLFSFTSLSTYIEHTAGYLAVASMLVEVVLLYAQLTHHKACLIYTSSLCPGSKDVGFNWNVVWGCYSADFFEETVAISEFSQASTF